MWSTQEAHEDDDCKCPPPGLPAYMGTFADLMALMLCFFVLLLSFSEMDAMKFRRLAGSMAQAFGVQNEMRLIEVPMGTSIVAQEFSPGRPEPTPINQIYQHTDSIPELTLSVQCAEEYELELGDPEHESGARDRLVSELQALIEETERDAMDLARALAPQIARGDVEIETRGRQIVIRIPERGSFASGSADLAAEYVRVLREVRDVLITKDGDIEIQGHTDNIPISTARFRSNWDLSASRAASVAHELLAGDVLDPRRLQVVGFADVLPLASNDTVEGRARNRRVEVVIRQGLDEDMRDSLQTLKQSDPETFRSLETEYRFELRPGEIF